MRLQVTKGKIKEAGRNCLIGLIYVLFFICLVYTALAALIIIPALLILLAVFSLWGDIVSGIFKKFSRNSAYIIFTVGCPNEENNVNNGVGQEDDVCDHQSLN